MSNEIPMKRCMFCGVTHYTDTYQGGDVCMDCKPHVVNLMQVPDPLRLRAAPLVMRISSEVPLLNLVHIE